ncbi:CPBP family intramembrane glutamic endopeptidase [Ruminiclostridium cellulolyticum]|uniref:Abortive infection protein n=1 Tax=Ruminiclostridium cellulolyticum (strain ATCC 35319 / DSM 5812 / JCM 6584 / H10) TaxID=394503 RepID=B8I2Y4_RUMCH|nr:CPBP family intramembrane glutamic endopeptidase [Ruminiclostridium cellulolyticum]ACL76127.1 Abortive infection protein [Ruminiclostridium cellulolyticum H10]
MSIKYQDMGGTGNTKPSRFVASVSVILYFYFFIGSFIGSIPIVYALIKNRDAFYDLTFSNDIFGFMDRYVNPFANYIFTNFTIYLMLAGLVIAVKFIHYRTFTSLITTKRKIEWSRFWVGFLVYGGLVSAGSLIDYFLSPETYTVSFDASKFWIALPFILIMTPLQAATDELVFRGYVIQSFGLKIKNGILLSAISGFMFTLPHLMNPEVTASNKVGVISTICMILNYFAIGMIFAMVTIKTNSLEAAIGAHAVNNLICFLIISYPDNVLSTNTVFYTTNFNAVGSLISVIITGILFYFITGLIIKEPIKSEKI